MSLNGSSSHAYNYSNDCYPHMDKPTEGTAKRKGRYQTRRLFEIEKEAVICLLIAILLFTLIYSAIMKRKMNNVHMEETPEENQDTPPPIVNPSVSSSMISPLSQSYVPFQSNSPMPMTTPLNNLGDIKL